MKIEKQQVLHGSSLSKTLVTRTPQGWLITRIMYYGDNKGKTSKSASSFISMEQVVDPNHEVDADDFFFDSENL